MIISEQNGDNAISAKLNSAFKDGLIIVGIAIITAVLFNLLRPAGISFFGFSPADMASRQTPNSPEITLSAAHDLFLKQQALFIDTRDPLSYEEGHIRGALNVSPDEAISRSADLKTKAAQGAQIITYCDGPQCPLSKQTAQILSAQGITGVKVLIDGWSLWSKNNYPTAKGK